MSTPFSFENELFEVVHLAVILREPETEHSTVMLDRCAAPYHRCLAPFQNPAAVDWASLRQQRLTNCPLPAILAAVGRACPKFLRSMIFHDLTQPYKATLGKRPGSGSSVLHITFRGVNRTIIISPRLHFPRPKDAQHPVAPELHNLTFSRASDGGWASYIEKAYVVMRGKNRYENLNMHAMDPPLTVNRFFFDVLGRFTKIQFETNEIFFSLRPSLNVEGKEIWITEERFIRPLTRGRLKALLILTHERPTIATTHAASSRLIREHTYLVTHLSRAGVHVQEFMRRSPPEAIPLADLGREFDAIYQSSSNCA
ncbi:hypothetical protein [Nitrosomonas sp. Nm132]|uniref:hypothetical protein n=1 Tax=Nitrosomonas sp. Nm132 TaxID=1881053 RepID=UPI0008868A5D|nr:hypothetical protein [Nitrosomonas sp. Nm132]SDG93741.1 hypothetical protein SAMN05428952_1002153 [Nitrosomonas sp. Nm132]